MPLTRMSYDEINKFLDAHKELTRIRQYKTNAYIQKFEDVRDKYFVIHDEGSPYLLICGYTEKLGFFKISAQPNQEAKEVKDADDILGPQAMEVLNYMFKKTYNKTMEAAFRTIKYKDVAAEIKSCVPSPINWSVGGWQKERILYGVKKADVSSAYPAELSKRVPTLEGHLRVPGRVEPSEEFPFAFYLKSQHIKLIEEDGTVVSTFDLAASKYYMAKTTKSCQGKETPKFYDIPAADDVTILCKPAKYSFKVMMDYLYENRQEHPEFKQYMNLSIGMFHKNKNPKFSYLAAVVLLRCSWVMNERLKKLENSGCSPLLVNTDSIAWIGDDISLTTTQKSLGAFVMEHIDCEMIICSPKKYQWKDGEMVNTTWAGVKGIKEKNLKFGDILDFQVIKENVPCGCRWNDETSRYITGGVII